MLSDLAVFLVILVLVAGAFRLFSRRKLSLSDEKGKFEKGSIRFTYEGKAFLVFSLLILASAVHTGVNLIYLTFSVLAGALLLSFVFVLFDGRKLRVERRTPGEVTAGRRFPGWLLVKNESSLLPVFCLSLEQELPEGMACEFRRYLAVKVEAGAEQRLGFEATALRRGLFRLPPIRYGTSFPFGFFERRAEARAPGELLILPRIGRLGEIASLDMPSGRQAGARRTLMRRPFDEFWGLREYRPGDSLSWIHWRTTARQHKPMVKEFIGQVQQRVLLALVLPQINTSRQEVNLDCERAISFVATLAVELNRRNVDLGLLAAGRRIHRVPFSRGHRQVHRIHRELALLEPAAETRPALHQTGTLLPQESASTILTVVGADKDSIDHLRRHLGAHASQVKVVDALSPDFSRMFSWKNNENSREPEEAVPEVLSEETQ